MNPAHRAQPAADSGQHRARRDRLLITAALALGLLAGIGLLIWSGIARSRDLEGAEERFGNAKVVGISPPRNWRGQVSWTPNVLVEVNGQVTSCTNVVAYFRLRIGGEARIAYRIGKSGAIYVDEVAPP